ncbi:MAG: hypothetical protein ABI690_02380 [Chloroflexota bacterium]
MFHKIKPQIYLIVIGCALFACTPQAPVNTSGLEAVTPVPTQEKQPTKVNQIIQDVVSVVSVSPTPTNICDEAASTTQATLPALIPSKGAFVRIQNNRFSLNGRPLRIYGIDYYPRDTPWRRFLTETDAKNLPQEFDLIQQAGINTLRIALRDDLLFQCAGSSLIPIAENIVRLDHIIQTAAQYHFHLILTLNDMPDLSTHPLYTDPQISDGQMIYLAGRYQNEPAIIGWDLHDSGDLDYLYGSFDRQTVLTWLSDTAIKMRQIDPNHLITATWRQDITAPIGIVDFVSVQVRSNLENLRQQIALLTDATDTPIILTSIGYSAFGRSEEGQRDSLQAALDAARNNRLAGWFVWTAFDFPLTVTCYTEGCINTDSDDHHFGLWTTDYKPKLAVDVIRFATNAP